MVCEPADYDRIIEELAATRQVPLQFHTGIGDEDVGEAHSEVRDERMAAAPVSKGEICPASGG